MGAEAAMIALGASGLASGILSSQSAKSNNQASLGFSKWSQLQAQEYNRQMYEKQLYDQKKMYEQYQSPQAIAQQLAKAGLNPSAMSGSIGSPSIPSVPSGGSSSPVSAPHLENQGLALGQGIESIAKAASSFAGANAQDAQANETRSMLQHKINSMLISQGLQQSQKDYQDAMNFLTEKYGDQKWSVDIQDTLSRALLNVANGNLSEAQTDYYNVLKLISDEDLGMKQEERAQFGVQLAISIDNLKKQGLLYDEQAKTEKSKQSVNYSQRDLNLAHKIESETRNKGLEFENVVKQINSETEANVAVEKLDALIEQLKRDKSVSRKEALEAEKESYKLRERIIHYQKYPNAAAFDEFWDNFPIIGGLVKGLSK